MKCANLGIDESPELLGGWWTSLKRGASSVASSTISVAKASGIPGLTQAANLTRSIGEQTEQYLPSQLRTGSAGSGSSAPDPQPTYQAPAKDNTVLYVGIGAVALLLLLKRK